MFVAKPNLPICAGTVLLDRCAPPSVQNALTAMNVKIIHSGIIKTITSAVSTHPDMSLHHVGENVFVCSKALYDYYQSVLPGNIILHCGSSTLGGNYPDDIAYNIARVGRYAIHHLKYTDPVIRSLLEKQNVTFIHVSQGYSKCSVCLVAENAIITADRGIASAASYEHIDVLLITPGSIELRGMEHGFIGGASGLLKKHTLLFAGNIAAHPDFGAIDAFCNRYGTQIVSLSNDNLVDIGSIIPIMEG